ncbi:MAG: hypothetical protein KAI47_23825, partial [Deltaproteobacteria bacterium]|nr:hypothetical protein [Deltaproteobacteria bacterium]
MGKIETCGLRMLRAAGAQEPDARLGFRGTKECRLVRRDTSAPSFSTTEVARCASVATTGEQPPKLSSGKAARGTGDDDADPEDWEDDD